ncbi:hypothetical protein WJX84_007388 [Apatococcus fuscideae]|uniref:N-acetyltransferase domain-containing protein n=1 Tax=Apatococcus fuscideae TaxID=2026836 RepID=A0AAW1T570_9CHLO
MQTSDCQCHRIPLSQARPYCRCYTVYLLPTREVATRAQRVLPAFCSQGFHQARLAAGPRRIPKNPQLNISVRPANSPEELEAAAVLRAQSFYAYPPERAYAGKIHQQMQAETEFQLLIETRCEELRRQKEAKETGKRQQMYSSCLIAVCQQAKDFEFDERLVLASEAVVGTLDVFGAQAPAGQVLIGNSKRAAYLANVCSSNLLRRQGVGSALLRSAIALGRDWGAEDLYVHIKAVNTSAEEFYCQFGFSKEKEESANHAHYRGHCLDGIEGKGRTALLRLRL